MYLYIHCKWKCVTGSTRFWNEKNHKKYDFSLVCVALPGVNNDSLNLSYIEDVCYKIGVEIVDINFYPVVELS